MTNEDKEGSKNHLRSLFKIRFLVIIASQKLISVRIRSQVS